MSATLSLPEDEAHVHYLFAEDARDPGLLETYKSWLSPEETERYNRFLVEPARLLFLLTRALVRGTLSAYLPAPPAAWQFEQGKRGKPSLVGPRDAWNGAAPLAFNLSNTTGLVAMVVAHGHDVGVDVEHAGRSPAVVDIAERFFAPGEVSDILAQPDERRKERFLTYWTLKEAYIKACGDGLAIPLHSFWMTLSGEQGAGVTFRGRDDRSDAWQIVRMRPGQEHLAAVAFRRAKVPVDARHRQPTLRLVERRSVPIWP